MLCPRGFFLAISIHFFLIVHFKSTWQRFETVTFLVTKHKHKQEGGGYYFYRQSVKIRKATAQDIWKKEKMILDSLKKEDYRILVIWQLDLEKNNENTAKKILKFAKS